ncbi:MAG TPA: hypothetical protein VH561_21970 [Micromonosporaceae bacterium]
MSKKDYVVRWENTVPASSPAEAALEAWEMIRDPSSTASFFVVDDGDREMEIDVLAPSSGQIASVTGAPAQNQPGTSAPSVGKRAHR